MFVLIAIYLYQFKSVSSLFRKILGMSEDGWVSVCTGLCFCSSVLRGCFGNGVCLALLDNPLTCLTFQCSWPWFGAVRHSGAVCTYHAPCCVPIGLYPPAALLQLRLPDPHWPRQRTCQTGFQVRRQECVQTWEEYPTQMNWKCFITISLMNGSAIFYLMTEQELTVVSVCILYIFWFITKHIISVCLSPLSNTSFSPPREEELRNSVNVISEM